MGRNLTKNIRANLPKTPASQMVMTVVLAVLLSGLVFSGLLTFRHSDYDDLMSRGEQLLAEGKVAKAAQTFESILRHYGESYPVYLNLGKAYLALNQPDKAEAVLQAALKLKPPSGSVDALLAQSQLHMVQGEYEAATMLLKERLNTLPKGHEGRVAVKTALAEVYTHWADSERDAGHVNEALAHYQHALQFVTNYSQEQAIQKDMADVALLLSEKFLLKQDPKGMLEALGPMMEWSTDPTLMIRLADAYQQTGELDLAIKWYCRAFDAEPENIRAKLSQVLLERGRELAEDKGMEAAQPYFDEAEALVAASGDEPSKVMLYPVRVSGFRVNPNFNREDKIIKPVATFSVVSEAHRNVDVLSARLQYRVGSKVWGHTTKVVADLDHPLGTIGQKNARRSVTMTLPQPIPVGELAGQTVRAELLLTYADAEAFEDVNWQTKAVQDIQIRAGGEATPMPLAEGSDAGDEPGQRHASFVEGVKPQ